jgi:hypothetical protein
LSEELGTINLAVEETSNSRSLTLDEAYELTKGKCRYQQLVFICVGITMISSMWYLYCISFPKVLDCKEGYCKNAKEAYVLPHYKYEDVHQNFITELDLLCKDWEIPLIPSTFPYRNSVFE